MNREREYVSELENMVIFMCKSYEEMQTIVFGEFPELRLKVPQIQGFELNMAISQLSKMEIVDPKISPRELVKKLEENHSCDYNG